ncbi:MAG TPA: TolC family protein [Burkholderiales bacterium]|nr:TolC family protein [Burkholderiales bacterium]
MLALASAHAGGADNLKEALDQAWARSPQAQAAEAREAELNARLEAAGSLLPAPPAVSLGYRSDQLNDKLGKREWGAEIEFPLWLPGEQRARLDAADREQSDWSAGLIALRLTLAGELRERVWAAALAENELRLARARLATAESLESDVARRMKAGDLARTDLLLAQNEALAAGAAVSEAEIRLAETLQAYHALTGEEKPPAQTEESPGEAPDLDRHPALEAARHAIALAQAKLKLAAESRRDAPEITLGALRERDFVDESYHDTIGIKLKIPFATDARNQPIITAAQTELVQAQAEYRQARLRIESEIRQKRPAFDAATAQLELARRKQAVAAENLRLLQKAFDLGELDLPALLRAKALAYEGDLALVQKTIAVGRARAALNQALGVLPK